MDIGRPLFLLLRLLAQAQALRYLRVQLTVDELGQNRASPDDLAHHEIHISPHPEAN